MLEFNRENEQSKWTETIKQPSHTNRDIFTSNLPINIKYLRLNCIGKRIELPYVYTRWNEPKKTRKA